MPPVHQKEAVAVCLSLMRQPLLKFLKTTYFFTNFTLNIYHNAPVIHTEE